MVATTKLQKLQEMEELHEHCCFLRMSNKRKLCSGGANLDGKVKEFTFAMQPQPVQIQCLNEQEISDLAKVKMCLSY